MKNLWLIILLVVLFSACSSTFLIKNDEASYKDLNKRLEGEEVTIELLNGDEITAENVKLSPGLWIPNDSSRTPTADIKCISYKNNAKGAWEWMGWGTLIGLPVGALIGWQVTAGDRFFSMDGSGASAEPLGILVGGLSGLLSGLIIGPTFGAVVGHRETYILNEPVEKYLTLEIKSILEETKQSVFFEWKNKKIRLSKSEIIEIIKEDKKIYLRIDEVAYIAFFQ